MTKPGGVSPGVEADFAQLYTTQLNILGIPTDDQTQEMATLSRLIFGLSSAYLLTGEERYRLAAAAGTKYQPETFRCLDGQKAERCVWASAKRKSEHGRVSKLLFASQNPDDLNQIPLYEQIYALAGLTQYYRISNDPEVFTDIVRTVRAFDYYWLDNGNLLPEGHPLKGKPNGYYSHIDYVTFTPSAEVLGQNRLRKNWNSIGDHLPAYLFNLLLAIDPLPAGREDDEGMKDFQATCRRMLANTTDLIRRYFPGDRHGDNCGPEIPKPERSAFVNERYFGDGDRNWVPDHGWGWQQNRAIVGHNLKIAWNLTRAAHYFLSVGDSGQAKWLMQLARKLGDDMAVKGIDQHRGGCFDAVERLPQNGMPYEITWLPTKDFWQQEQAILAYLLLHGYTGEPEYLQLAREMEAFWNLFFLDRDHWGIVFRVREDGSQVIDGTYGDKGGHAISGYHSFELNFLAHIYTRVFLPQYSVGPEGTPRTEAGHFCLFFRPTTDLRLIDGETTFNLLPDFFPPGLVSLETIQVAGVARNPSAAEAAGFFVRLHKEDLGSQVVAVFRSCAHFPLPHEMLAELKLDTFSPHQMKFLRFLRPHARVEPLTELVEEDALQSMTLPVPRWQVPTDDPRHAGR